MKKILNIAWKDILLNAARPQCDRIDAWCASGSDLLWSVLPLAGFKNSQTGIARYPHGCCEP